MTVSSGIRCCEAYVEACDSKNSRGGGGEGKTAEPGRCTFRRKSLILFFVIKIGSGASTPLTRVSEPATAAPRPAQARDTHGRRLRNSGLSPHLSLEARQGLNRPRKRNFQAVHRRTREDGCGALARREPRGLRLKVCRSMWYVSSSRLDATCVRAAACHRFSTTSNSRGDLTLNVSLR